MFVDIVFPKGNEAHYFKVARRLGTKALCFAYPYDKSFKARTSSLKAVKEVNVYFAALLRPSEAMRQVKLRANAKPDLLIVRSSKYNREIIDRGEVDLIYDFEAHPGSDSLMQKKSNLNHIMAKKAYENGIMLGINISSLNKAKLQERIRYMGRISQNLNLASKYKMQITAFSGATKPGELRSFTDMFSLIDALSKVSLARSSLRSEVFNRLK